MKIRFPKLPVRPGHILTFVLLTAFLAGAASYIHHRRVNAVPSLEIMAGQMIMIGFPGSSIRESWPHIVARQIKEGKIGGVVMLGYNFKDRNDVLALTQLFHGAAESTPPFIALDQEGGLVQRLGKRMGYEAQPAAKTIAATMSPEQAQPIFDRLAIDAHQAGFNVNLAPVVDLEMDAANPGVGGAKRTYGSDPASVTNYARAFIQSQHRHGMLPVIKHFPGHGSSTVDPHLNFADISATWSPQELEPFKSLIAMNPAPAIMAGHLLHRELAGGDPASLSAKALNQLLRQTLGFNGIIICDDLQMPAILNHYSLEEALILAIQAGVDIVMVTNTVTPDPHLPEKLITMICDAVEDGRLQQSAIEDAWRRIIEVKKQMALQSRREDQTPSE